MKKNSKRLLSAFLALSLCLGLMSPMALAAEPGNPVADNLPLKLTFSNPDGLGAGENGQVYIDGLTKGLDGIGVKDFVYSVSGNAANKVTLDTATGAITVKDGQTIVTGDKVTVTADINYYPADQLHWADDMETEKSLTNDPSGNTKNLYSLNHSETSFRTGRRAGTPAEAVKNGVWKDGINQTGTLTFWYYDTATEEETTRTYDDQVKFGVMIDAYTTLFLGVAVPSITGDLNPDGNKFTEAKQRDPYRTTYTYRAGSRWYRTNIERTEGWHKFEINVASDGTTMFIDGAPVCLNGTSEPIKNTNVTSISKAIIATNWGDKAEMKTYVNDKHFIDDIYIVKPDASTANCKPTVEISLKADQTEPPVGPTEPPAEPTTPPVDAVLIGGETLTPGGVTSTKIRLNTATANAADGKYVVDEITEYEYDANKITIDANGVVTIKEGYTPSGEETIPVTVKYKYYGGNDVKYVENFDDATATPFANSKGINYAINDGQSRTGQFGVTAKAIAAGSNDKAATATVGPFENVKVTAWYYDPFDDKEKAFKDTGLERFGFAATHDTSVVNTNQLGVFSNKGTNDKISYYGYRVEPSGNFVLSEVSRTAGWKKLEWLVDNNGTSMYINGTLVAAKSDRTNVSNLTLVTNWCQDYNQDGMKLIYDRHYIDDVSIVDASASPAPTSTVVNVTIAPDDVPPEPPASDGFKLTLANPDGLRKGEQQRVYIEGMDDVGIESFKYTITGDANVLEKVNFDENTGVLTIKDGKAPAQGDTITVGASVTYYPKEQLLWAEDMETPNSLIPADSVYGLSHSGVSDLTGLGAARTGKLAGTSQTTRKDGMFSPAINSTGKLVYWYYDPYTKEEQDRTYSDQVKFGMMINNYGDLFLGVAVPASTEVGVDAADGDSKKQEFRTTYTYRENFKWLRTNIERKAGWRKMEINVTADGSTMFIDGEPVCLFGSETPITNTAVKSITKAIFATNWGDKADQIVCINNKHFIDDVYIIKPNTTPNATTENLDSVTMPLLDIQYTHSPQNPTVDSTYPADLTVMVKPNLDELKSVTVDSTLLTEGQWSKYLDNGPKNAAYYPAEMKGWKLTVDGSAFEGLSADTHKLVLTMTSGSTYEIPFTAAANTYVAKEYYLSNNGDDSKAGNTAATAWKTFAKLSTVTFGPGDKIFLDATSFWNDVQFQPKGSGAPGAPIVMTKYNDEGDPSKRPILHGNGTTANKNTSEGDHSYLAFDSWRLFYPSGTVELFNVEHWEVRGLEITNYKATYTQEAAGRNGIAVIHDYFETQGITTLPSGDKAKEEAFYKAGKLQHIVLEDNYIHDVTGWHPGSGAKGAGQKMSGGINVYGPYDDLKLDNNIIMYCDVEGIRNDVLAWRGDTRTQFPAYMEGISISNNFIVGVPGDGVVMSSAIEPRLANNYLADAGYSYMVDKAGSTTTAKVMGNRDNPVIINNSTNFAGLWFIGTDNAVAEYNESVNNVWTCNDGEAFDADMFTWGTMFQYNYTYRNNGGFCLFMTGNQMDDGTIVRYNVSIEDGEGIGTPDHGRKAIFHYNKEPDAIYNNLFVLGNGVRGMFGGDSDVAYFYNNMVIKPDGQIGNFNLNTYSNSNAAATSMTGGALKNNLFYPAAILDNVTGAITKADNITPATLDGIFYDLTAFMAAQPVHALNGRSALTGTPVNMTGGAGAGFAMSDAAGRSVKVPTGGFDYTQFEGIKTVEGSPTIGAGIKVDHGHDGYKPYPGNEAVYPLKTDFFKNTIGEATPDIGPYQWSADASHFVKLTYEGNGATVAAETVKSSATHTLPAPTKDGYLFEGWYTEAELTNEVASPYTVPAAGVKLYAKWTVRPADTFDVIFDSQGGSPVATLIAVAKDAKISAPADPTREHYVFSGWFKEKACTNAWVFDTDTVTANTTLYAKWVGETFTVTFDKNGGTTEADPATKTVIYPATTVDDLPTAPTKEGFTFLGWTITKDGEDFFDATTLVSASITVYAKWAENAANTYNVLFDAQGGSTVNPIVGVAKDSTITAPANPTKEHYVFSGWFKEESCTNAWVFDTDTVGANTTLYAKWVGETFTVTFNNNGGTTEADPATKTVIYPATTVDALPTAPTKAEHTFMGWTTTQNGSTVFDTTTAVTANITVYAKWASNDDLAIAAAKTLVEEATYTIAQANAITEATVRARLVAMVEALDLKGVTAQVTKVSYTSAIAGTEGTPAGTDGSYVFTVGLSKGTGTPVTTEQLTMTITATAYVAPSPSPSNPTPKPKPVEKPAENVTATEGGDVTVKENKDGSSTYTFKPEKEKEVLYVRVNGLLVKADSYTAAKGEEPSIVVVFGESGTDHTKDYTDTAQLPDYMTEAVNYVVDSGLFQGNDNSFMPMDNMNRAMFATVLARLYGADTAALTSDFADVAQNAWYAGGVAWISQMGITSGVGGNHFAPEADMTRQELVTLVYRFAQKVGADVSASGDLTTFPDGDSVDTWSADAMRWAVGLGMINGKSGALAPSDTITRVEAAIILQRMADLLVKA